MEKLEETVKDLKYDAAGLIPAVVVDATTKQVLMVAYMKGESSGHTQEVKAIYTDCDKDTLVIEAVQKGAACHLGYLSCFFRKLNDEGQWDVISEKLFDPDEVYKKK